MAPLSLHSSTDALLGDSPKQVNKSPLLPLSSTTQAIIKTLSVVRIATGAACLVAPRFTCALFRHNVPAEQALLVRMIGARDALFGELLITAEDKESGDGGRR